MPLLVIPINYKCRAYSRLSVTTGAVVPLEAAKRLHPTYGPCAAVLITIEDNDVRRRIDSGNPSTGADGNGAILVKDSAEFIQGGLNTNNLRLIGLSGTGIVHVDYFYEK